MSVSSSPVFDSDGGVFVSPEVEPLVVCEDAETGVVATRVVVDIGVADLEAGVLTAVD